MLRVGIDVGGTFTDIVVLDEVTGAISSAKVLTTPENQAVGVMQSLASAGAPLADVSFLAHGTTTGTNALIERKGARTGLLTTEGFRDVLEIMRTDRASGYDLSWEKPVPLVRRRLRGEVRERADKDGRVQLPLDEQQARRAIAELVERGAESIAVSLLHAYTNPEHELRVRELIDEVAPGTAVSLSSEINAEYREYERTSTVVVDAYIKPVMERYIRRLIAELEAGGLGCRPYLMQGSGGMITAVRAVEKPIATLSSGPAAGAIAAAKVAARAGLEDIVTFDVGGTSTDVALICDARPFVTTTKHVEWGLPVRVPMVDVESVGAGGGSIAWVDEGGGLKVGPQSAGANPGPICYGRGGVEPTLSDALCVAGVLGVDLADGQVKLDRAAAEAGLRALAGTLGLSLERIVAGVIEIAGGNMANAVRSVSIWKGVDPRDLTLVAYGGAGGMVAGMVARSLGIPRVLVPAHPGNTCAMGLLMTDMQEDATLALLAGPGDLDLDALNRRLDELRSRCLATLSAQGVPVDAVSFTHAAELRYHGQIHALSIRFEAYPVDAEALERTFGAFEQTYEDVYTIRLEGGTPEMTSVRVTAVGELPQYAPGAVAWQGTLEPTGARAVLEGETWTDVHAYSRYAVPSGVPLHGPLVVEEPGSTIWVGRHMTAEVDEYGNLLIATGGLPERALAAAIGEEA